MKIFLLRIDFYVIAKSACLENLDGNRVPLLRSGLQKMLSAVLGIDPHILCGQIAAEKFQVCVSRAEDNSNVIDRF